MWKKVRHVIWDWNGTILDDTALCTDVLNEVLTKNSFDRITVDRFRDLVEFPVQNLYEKLGFDFAKTPYPDLAHHFHDSYEKRREECGLHREVKKVLDHFSSKNYTQSILSAHPKYILENSVQIFGVKEYFSLVSGLEDNAAHGKQSLGVEHVRKLSIPKECMILIGDTDHDLAVANHLGIPCVLVASGHQARHKLEGLGAPVFDHLAELLENTATST